MRPSKKVILCHQLFSNEIKMAKFVFEKLVSFARLAKLKGQPWLYYNTALGDGAIISQPSFCSCSQSSLRRQPLSSLKRSTSHQLRGILCRPSWTSGWLWILKTNLGNKPVKICLLLNFPSKQRPGPGVYLTTTHQAAHLCTNICVCASLSSEKAATIFDPSAQKLLPTFDLNAQVSAPYHHRRVKKGSWVHAAN